MLVASSLSDYRVALTTPGARGPVLASLLARLPIAMIGLASLLYVQRETGSYATASLVSASTLIGVAIGSVAQGRVIDRFGPARPVYLICVAYAGLMVGFVPAVERGAPIPVLVVLGLALGLTEPMVAAPSRAMWPRLLAPGPVRDAALAYEAISMEAFFILGPGIAGLLAAAPWPGTGLVVSSALMIVGALVFVLTPTNRRYRPEPARHEGPGIMGALASPGMRTVAVAALGFGVTVGFVEVAVPAAASAAGNQSAGGLLLSLWSVSSVAFGLLYGMRPWPRQMHLRLPVLLAGFAALLIVAAVPTGLTGLALALLLSGTLITPQATTHSAALEQVAPAGTVTEAFGWVVTAVTVGIAIGQSISGQVVTDLGPRAAFPVAAVAGLVIAAVVFLARGTVRRGTPEFASAHD